MIPTRSRSGELARRLLRLSARGSVHCRYTCPRPERLAFVDGRIEPREYLSLTASIDHDIVDGAPAARFAKHLRELIERGEVLQDISR